MDAYQSLSVSARREVLEDVSRKAGIAVAIVEKDYWVCRTLAALFALPDLGTHLVFKGGTSLSKVYRLIDRFSEDVDVSFHREYLGFGADHDPEAASGNEQKRRLEALQKACTACIRDRLLPALKAELERQLGPPQEWNVSLDEEDPQTLLFHFPRATTAVLPYIAPMVRIELGARSDAWPREEHTIRSLMGETLGQPLGIASVQVLAAERTFWEKATLLHAECHRHPATPVPPRVARHYCDMARLATAPVADRALGDVTLRKRVVTHKSVYFRSAWARYDLAAPATFRLVPSPARQAELEKDYAAMQEMFFAPPPPMREILRILGDLERRIRALPE